MTTRTDIEDMTDAQDEAPERIWLQEPVGLEYERSWCAEPQSDNDTPYIRADLARPLQAGDERVAEAMEACRIIDAAVKEGHDSVSDLLMHLLEAAVPARAALAAMDTPKGGGDGWQPIETAPRDGTSILTFPNYHVTHYEADPAECFTGPGWVASWDDGLDAYITMCKEPTHWMPLPPAPPAAMKDGG